MRFSFNNGEEHCFKNDLKKKKHAECSQEKVDILKMKGIKKLKNIFF